MPGKSKVTIVYKRSHFEALHEKGAVRFGADWIRANGAAVDVLRKFNLDPADLGVKELTIALVSAVLAAVIDREPF